MRPRTCPFPRRTRLDCELLQDRVVPAGNVDASIPGGVLTLTGDDLSNNVTIQITMAGTLIPPDLTTSVNGGTPGLPELFPAVLATSLKASFLGGNDLLSIESTSDFILPGGANVDLGGGTNALNFLTSAKVELGS